MKLARFILLLLFIFSTVYSQTDSLQEIRRQIEILTQEIEQLIRRSWIWNAIFPYSRTWCRSIKSLFIKKNRCFNCRIWWSCVWKLCQKIRQRYNFKKTRPIGLSSQYYLRGIPVQWLDTFQFWDRIWTCYNR